MVAASAGIEQPDAVAPFNRKRDTDPVDPNDRSATSGLKYKDLAVLDQLVKAGADLTEPRHVLYYLYFSSRSVADAAAEEASDNGFGADVREPLPQYPDQWSVICERPGEVLDPKTVLEHGDFFRCTRSAPQRRVRRLGSVCVSHARQTPRHPDTASGARDALRAPDGAAGSRDTLACTGSSLM